MGRRPRYLTGWILGKFPVTRPLSPCCGRLDQYLITWGFADVKRHRLRLRPSAVGVSAYCPKCNRRYVGETKQLPLFRGKKLEKWFRFWSYKTEGKLSYFCEICNCYHRKLSKIGSAHNEKYSIIAKSVRKDGEYIVENP